MMTLTREASQFVVQLVDLSQHGERGEYGYVETSGGLFILCHEGVGPKSPITEESPAEFVDGTALGPAALRELATGETQPLHEFIRSFGDRLERNYAAWEAALRAV